MSPTIVMKDGNRYYPLAQLVGPRIITSTLQLIINNLDYGMMMDSAVKHPHMCCLTLNQGLELEEGSLRIRSSFWRQKDISSRILPILENFSLCRMVSVILMVLSSQEEQAALTAAAVH